MLKTPQNLTAPLHTDRKKTDERVCYSLGITKTSYGAQRMVCLEPQREDTSHLFTSGSEVRDYHIFRNRRGHTMEHDVLMLDTECVWGGGSLLVSGFAGHAWD